ncbi:MAG: molecular chaperone DnaJ [Candidatus Acidiferrales bacterium]
MAAFERIYLKTVGVLYAELDEIEARIAELHARRNPSSAGAQETARQARQKATESYTSVGGIALQGAKSFKPSPELKSLYREVARRIHPDLAADDGDRARRQRFMARANRAYEEGNEAGLRAILEEYESSPDTVVGEGIGAELVRVIRKIAQVRRRLREIGEEMERVLGSELAQLKSRADEAIKQGRDLLEEMAESLRDEISSRKKQLSVLGEVHK